MERGFAYLEYNISERSLRLKKKYVKQDNSMLPLFDTSTKRMSTCFLCCVLIISIKYIFIYSRQKLDKSA